MASSATKQASASRLTLERIELAARTIDPVFLHTPQFLCESLSDDLGVQVALKIETLNPIRCFKGRGADFLVAQRKPGTALLCASAGNFGQAMAYACRQRGLELTVFAANTANPLKLERMRKLGASVLLHGVDFDEAKLEARRVAGERGACFVEDSLDVETVEGAGTMGLEWLEFAKPLDVLLIPLGNGAMFNGVAAVLKARSPRTQLVAVQAVGAPAMLESWRTGCLVVHQQMNTIADGIGVRAPVPEALADMQGLADDGILVRDDSMVEGMRLLQRHAGVVAEPSAAAGLAAILEQPHRFRGRTVGTIVSGGNLTPEQIRQWLG